MNKLQGKTPRAPPSQDRPPPLRSRRLSPRPAARTPQPPPTRSPVRPPPTRRSATPPAREGTPEPLPRRRRCVLLLVVLCELLLLLVFGNDVLNRLDRDRSLPRRLQQPRGGGVGKGGSRVGGRRLRIGTDASSSWPAASFFSSSAFVGRRNAPVIALLDRG